MTSGTLPHQSSAFSSYSPPERAGPTEGVAHLPSEPKVSPGVLVTAWDVALYAPQVPWQRRQARWGTQAVCRRYLPPPLLVCKRRTAAFAGRLPYAGAVQLPNMD